MLFASCARGQAPFSSLKCMVWSRQTLTTRAHTLPQSMPLIFPTFLFPQQRRFVCHRFFHCRYGPHALRFWALSMIKYNLEKNTFKITVIMLDHNKSSHECDSKHVEVWQAQTEDYSVLCEFKLHNNTLCNIMHENTCDVNLSPLARKWPTVDGCADTLYLPCGHTFHPCALALHFLSTNMRCPVCRKGSTSRMQLSYIPTDMQALFSEKLLSINEAEESYTLRAFEHLIKMFELQLQIFPCSQWTDSTPTIVMPSTISTRLIPDNPDDLTARVQQRLRTNMSVENDTMQFRVHHSFNRCIQAMYNVQCSSPESQSKHMVARWAIKHQFFANNICTVSMPLHSVLHCAFNESEHERQSMLLYSPSMTGDAVLASLTSLDTGEVKKLMLDIDFEFLVTVAHMYTQSVASLEVL